MIKIQYWLTKQKKHYQKFAHQRKVITNYSHLVLHSGGVDSSPVHQAGSGTGGLQAGNNVLALSNGGLLGSVGGQVASGKFSLGHISKLGDAVSGRSTGLLLGLIALVGELQVLQEKSESLAFLLRSGVIAVVLGLEGLPHVLLDSGVARVELGISSGSNGQGDNNLINHFGDLVSFLMKKSGKINTASRSTKFASK